MDEKLYERGMALRRQVVGVACMEVVAVGVRDQGVGNRPPGVDVEIARRAVQPLGAGHHQIVVHWHAKTVLPWPAGTRVGWDRL